jgi:hypothetical protein
VLAHEGDLAAAQRELEAAVAGLRGMPVPFPLARCLLDLATVLQAQHRSSEAEPLLEEARSLFTGLRATPWVARTEALLAPSAVRS